MTSTCSTISLLTLGLTSADQTPSTTTIVNLSRASSGNDWTVSGKVNTVNDLIVNTTTIAKHRISFNGAYNRLDLNTTGGPGDGGDTITFNATLTKARILTGNSKSSAGDQINFNKSIAGTTLTTSNSKDNIVFFSTASGSTINAGLGSDSIRFTATTSVGAGIAVNLGGASPTSGDGAADIVFVNTKNSLVATGIRINNFESGRDRIVVGSTAITTQSQADAFFGSGSVILSTTTA